MGRPKKGTEKLEDTVLYAGRLTISESDELIQLAKNLKEKNVIKEITHYSITQYALRSLLKTLKNKFGA